MSSAVGEYQRRSARFAGAAVSLFLLLGLCACDPVAVSPIAARQHEGALEFKFCEGMHVERARVETRRLPNDWELQVDRLIDLTIDTGDVIPYATFSGTQATTIELKPDDELVISLVGPGDTQTAHFVWPVDAGDSWTTVDGGTSSKPCE